MNREQDIRAISVALNLYVDELSNNDEFNNTIDTNLDNIINAIVDVISGDVWQTICEQF